MCALRYANANNGPLNANANIGCGSRVMGERKRTYMGKATFTETTPEWWKTTDKATMDEVVRLLVGVRL